MSVLIAMAILFPYGMPEDDAAGKEIRGVILATSDMNGNIWDFSYEKTEKPATERLHLSCQKRSAKCKMKNRCHDILLLRIYKWKL